MISLEKDRGWGSVPSSNPARSARVGRASGLESPTREEVLERFLLGFEGTSLPQWLADMLSAGLAEVGIYPRNYGVHSQRMAVLLKGDHVRGRAFVHGGLVLTLLNCWPRLQASSHGGLGGNLC